MGHISPSFTPLCVVCIIMQEEDMKTCVLLLDDSGIFADDVLSVLLKFSSMRFLKALSIPSPHSTLCVLCRNTSKHA